MSALIKGLATFLLITVWAIAGGAAVVMGYNSGLTPYGVLCFALGIGVLIGPIYQVVFSKDKEDSLI